MYPGFVLSAYPSHIFSQLGVCGQLPVEHGGSLSYPSHHRHRPGMGGVLGPTTALPWPRSSGPAPSLRPRPASRPHPSLQPLNPCLDSRRLEGVLCSPPSALAHLPSWDENQDFPSAPRFPRPRPPAPSRCPSGLTGGPGALCHCGDRGLISHYGHTQDVSVPSRP